MQGPHDWPQYCPTIVEVPEIKSLDTLCTITEIEDILDNFSSYTHALRIIAYIYRFLHKTLLKYRKENYPCTGVLSQAEINNVKFRLIMLSQKKNTFKKNMIH